jgi:hypothetical protein
VSGRVTSTRTSGVKALRYSPIRYAIVAGLALGAVQVVLVAVRMFGMDGVAARAGVAEIAWSVLLGFPVCAVIWWRFVARRDPSETSVRRGVTVGALSSVAAIAMFPIVQIVAAISSSLGTDTAGDVATAAGEMSLYLVAGVLMALIWGWMDIVASMLVGAALVSWYRRAAGPVISRRFDPGEQAPENRTRCDACGEEYPSHEYLHAAGSLGYICRSCTQSP